jgi:iron complex outermembrane receptor protein
MSNSNSVYSRAMIHALPMLHVVSHNRVTVQKAPGTVVRARDIRRDDDQSIKQVLQNQSGVRVVQSGGGAQSVSLRGFGGNASANTLVLLNGLPLNTTSMAGAPLRQVDVHNIQSIQVNPTSQSVLYGSGAVGGVVNIITRAPVQQYATVAMSAGLPGFQQVDVEAAGPSKNGWAFTGGMLGQRNMGFRAHSENDQAQAHAAALYHHNGNTLNIRVLHSKSRLLFPGALTAGQLQQDRDQAGDYTGVGYHSNTHVLVHAAHVRGAMHYQLNTSYQNSLSHGHWTSLGVANPFTQHAHRVWVVPSVVWHEGAWTTHTGVSLAQGRYDYSNNDNFGTRHSFERDQSVFGTAGWQFAKAWTWKLGARAYHADIAPNPGTPDQNDRGTVFSTGLYVKLEPGISWYVRRAMSYRLPLVDEFAGPGVATPALNVQRATDYETGLHFNKPYVQGRIAWYDMFLTHEISFAPGQGGQPGANRNLPPTVRRGILASFVEPLQKWRLSEGFTLSQNRFRSGAWQGHTIPWSAPVLAHAGVGYHFDAHWYSQVQMHYAGGEYMVFDDANAYQKQGGYSTYDWALHYHAKPYIISLRVNNLTNKHFNSYVSEYAGDGSFYPGEGVSGVLTLTYAFM